MLPQLACKLVRNRWIPCEQEKRNSILHVLSQKEEFTKTQVLERLKQPVDLYQGPQIRITILRSATRDTICVVMNHMLCDGMAFKEYLYLLAELYSNIAQHKLVQDILQHYDPAKRSVGCLFHGISKNSAYARNTNVEKNAQNSVKKEAIVRNKISVQYKGSVPNKVALSDKYSESSKTSEPSEILAQSKSTVQFRTKHHVSNFRRNARKAEMQPFFLQGEEANPQFMLTEIEPTAFSAIKKYARMHDVTINDIFMAAYFCAANQVFQENKLRNLVCAVDLRKYLPGKKAPGLCNLTGNLHCQISKIPDEINNNLNSNNMSSDNFCSRNFSSHNLSSNNFSSNNFRSGNFSSDNLSSNNFSSANFSSDSRQYSGKHVLQEQSAKNLIQKYWDKRVFEEILEEVHQCMEEQKSSMQCLKQIRLLDRVYSWLPFSVSSVMIAKALKNPPVAFTNLGIVDDKRLSFAGLTVTDAFLTGSMKEAPNFQAAVSTFRDKVIVSVNMKVAKADKMRIETFLEIFKQQLLQLS